MDKRSLFWKIAYLAIAGGVFLIDQTTKAWAARTLRFDGDKSVIDGLLHFTYAVNPGVAFSMFDEQGDAGRWGLSIVAFVAGVLVLYFFWRTPRTDDRILGALALLLAGISGNLCDRVRLGSVIDFIDVQLGSWHYPTFNVADSAICIGAGLLLLDIVFSKKKKAADEISEAAA
ncbi:MAG TPA: signal peptidase II [Pyrinomonadaceae bacterium]|jgi:signal peptidase II|nr:signal peptidase II [Pyrinomonadaceae bacterium]